MLTNENLLKEQDHPAGIGGVQRLYRFKSGYGLSLVNSPKLHSYSFAWEAAVLKDLSEDGETFELTYDTELTADVEVFANDEEANVFIEKAVLIFGKETHD